jgi:HlyD family secretion protein
MNTRIFRGAALERLSSPEELDQVVTISMGGGWAALTAILLLCAGALTWGIKGTVPTTASGSGMIVSTGGVLNVVARGAGVVQSVGVAVGQHVDANQVVATIGQPALAERVQAMKQELSEVLRKHQQDQTLKAEEIQIRLDAIGRQRSNLERSITEFTDQARLASERIPAMEQLLARGLVTNQQVIAARQARIDLNAQVADRSAQLKQLDAQAFELRTQAANLNSAARFEIANRERQIASAATDLALQETVTTPYAGAVVEVQVSQGGSVAAGSSILSIQPDSDALEVLTYVSSMQAKDIRRGLEARIAPSAVKREEFGYLRGKVLFVADYPATAAAIMRSFQNEPLVRALAEAGPVTEVRIGLERDDATVSGFSWSSRGGPPIRITAGTIATADIVTETRAPITLVIPILRQTLGL